MHLCHASPAATMAAPGPATWRVREFEKYRFGLPSRASIGVERDRRDRNRAGVMRDDGDRLAVRRSRRAMRHERVLVAEQLDFGENRQIEIIEFGDALAHVRRDDQVKRHFDVRRRRIAASVNCVTVSRCKLCALAVVGNNIATIPASRRPVKLRSAGGASGRGPAEASRSAEPSSERMECRKPLCEKTASVERPRRCLRMELHRCDRQLAMTKSFVRAIVEVGHRRFELVRASNAHRPRSRGCAR